MGHTEAAIKFRKQPRTRLSFKSILVSCVLLEMSSNNPNPNDGAPAPNPPFHRTQNFAFAMVAIVAVSLTIAVLALTGNLKNSPSKSPAQSKNTPAPTPAERSNFKFSERGEIKDMLGKKITITGDIDRLESDAKGRYLLFKESDPRDVMLYFNPAKIESSEWILKRKFAGQKVRASGTVLLDDRRLLLEMSSMDDLRLHSEESTPTATP